MSSSVRVSSIRVVRPRLGQVADVADVVALAVLVDVVGSASPCRSSPPHARRLRGASRCSSPAAEVVDLADRGSCAKAWINVGDVERVNVVADLLALIAVHLVGRPFHVALDEVAEEAVQLDATVVRARSGSRPAGSKSCSPK